MRGSLFFLSAFIAIFLGGKAFAQTPGTNPTYANCGAIPNNQFITNSPNASQTITIDQLLDTDLITIRVIKDADTTVVVKADGIELLSLGKAKADVSKPYDPDGTMQPSVITLIDDIPTFDPIIQYYISCEPDAGSVFTRSPAANTTAFLAERINRLLEESPDRARLVRKRLHSLWGGVEGETSLAGYGADGRNFRLGPTGGRAHFSLRSLVNISNADLPGKDALPAIPHAPPPDLGCWDAWGEAHYTRYKDAGDRRGDFAVGYVGIDCQFHPAIIAGVLAQVDWMDDRVGAANVDIDGVGWMVGPYASARLTPNLYFDVRAAWGQSDNDNNTPGAVGSFDTTRWLVTGQLTGDFKVGELRISPEVQLAYIREKQDSYVNSTGATVGAQTVSLGRLRFGPEIARRYEMSPGLFIEPSLAFRGIWDFDGANAVMAGQDYSVKGLRGIAELGVLVGRPEGLSLRMSAKYDGIGKADYHAYGGQMWISVPLN